MFAAPFAVWIVLINWSARSRVLRLKRPPRAAKAGRSSEDTACNTWELCWSSTATSFSSVAKHSEIVSQGALSSGNAEKTTSAF